MDDLKDDLSKNQEFSDGTACRGGYDDVVESAGQGSPPFVRQVHLYADTRGNILESRTLHLPESEGKYLNLYIRASRIGWRENIDQGTRGRVRVNDRPLSCSGSGRDCSSRYSGSRMGERRGPSRSIRRGRGICESRGIGCGKAG